MASITTIFKHGPEPQEDNDKLVDLFRNRVELKKEFAALRNEKYQLQDRIKERQGAVERTQQKLNHLESLLLDPEWVHNVVVFYQFRRLAAHCEMKLDRFAEQLKQQREQRALKKELAFWKKKCKRSSKKVHARIGEHRVQVQALEDQLQVERHKLLTMGSIAKMLRGRSQATVVSELETSISAEQAAEQDLMQELHSIENREPPPPEGLDIAAKRSINFMILAFAQQLYLDYLADNLVGLAKESSEKSVGAINYGTKFECDELLERLNRRKEEVEQNGDFAELLKTRAKMITEQGLFRNDDDAVPVPGTVSTVFDIDRNGMVSRLDANLLGENYFGVAKVLSR